LFKLKPRTLEEQTDRIIQKATVQVAAAIVAGGAANIPGGKLTPPRKEAIEHLDAQFGTVRW
jgi:hypothetical protein